MTIRALRDEVQNALDFLLEAELALYTNPVAMSSTHVGWHALHVVDEFLISSSHATVSQYLAWVKAGAYSAVLRDGSLIQLSYEWSGGSISGHRLAYVPCPVMVDEGLLEYGEPIGDVVPLYLDDAVAALLLRSPIRFDFDPAAARPGHPAAHLSINNPDCRVACVAPIHPYRFIDFIFKHFYPVFRRAHETWFAAAARRHLGIRVITDNDRNAIHLTWPVHPVA